ncbi:MAG: PEGA domain-containing protein [Myxococcaceae bacterium]|nr:PEGA domain-containing protein [Myxococcaceae bacterium]
MRRALFLVIALAAGPVLAQEDDLPALPTAPKQKPKPRPKARPKTKPAPVADDDLPALPTQKGDLLVKLAPAVKGAKLTIDDREIGTLPQGPQTLTAGEHTVTVRRLGYAPFTKKVTVAANKTSDVNVSLEASAAVLTVSCDVAGAQVFVNGRLAGTAPLIELEVPPGSTEIAVRKDGYYDGSQTLNAKAGRDYPIEVKLGAPIAATVVATNKSDAPVRNDLTPSSSAGGDPVTATETIEDAPVYKKWWFWTAAAVVIAAGVGIGVGVGANSGPAPGVRRSNFDCHPNCDGWINQPAAIR